MVNAQNLYTEVACKGQNVFCQCWNHDGLINVQNWNRLQILGSLRQAFFILVMVAFK